VLLGGFLLPGFGGGMVVDLRLPRFGAVLCSNVVSAPELECGLAFGVVCGAGVPAAGAVFFGGVLTVGAACVS
jgi:hypothetical protein